MEKLEEGIGDSVSPKNKFESQRESYKKHRPHIKVGKDAKEEEDVNLQHMNQNMQVVTARFSILLSYLSMGRRID